jgi:hypothetical protein
MISLARVRNLPGTPWRKEPEDTRQAGALRRLRGVDRVGDHSALALHSPRREDLGTRGGDRLRRLDRCDRIDRNRLRLRDYTGCGVHLGTRRRFSLGRALCANWPR